MKKAQFMVRVVWVFALFLLSSALTVISLSSHRDPKHPSVPYHYYEPSGPDECTMYLSHERGRKGSHHRFITEKRVFKNWARTFNIRFFQPDWKPEPPAVNHAEDKPVFWGVLAFSLQPQEEELELQAGEWELDSGAVQHHGQNPTARDRHILMRTDSVTLPREEHSRVEVLPLKPEQEQPNTFNCISLQTSTSKDFSIRL